MVYIIDSEIDRNDEAGLLDYLEIKYEIGPIQTMDMGYIGAEMIVHADASDLPE